MSEPCRRRCLAVMTARYTVSQSVLYMHVLSVNAKAAPVADEQTAFAAHHSQCRRLAAAEYM